MKLPRSLPAFLLLAVVALATTAIAIKPRAHGECLNAPQLRDSARTFPRHFFIEAPVEEEDSQHVKLTVAQDFSVEYFDHFKVVRNLRANDAYVLHHCGMDQPSEEQLPSDLRGKNFSNFFAVPLNRVSVPDTSAFGFMKELGLEDRISFVTQFTVDACAAKLFEEGDNACNRRTRGSSAEGFKEQEALADAIFSFGKNDAVSKMVAFTATADPGVLNRAEWLKFMATFFNVEDRANALYSQIEKDYKDAKDKVAAYVSDNGRPLVAWLYYQPASQWGDELIELKFGPFQSDYMQDAGGRMLDLEALKEQYTPDNADINQKADWSGNLVPSLEFKNLTSVNTVLAEILKDVKIIVDETNHFFIPESSNEALSRSRAADMYKIASGPVRDAIEDGSIKIVRLDASENEHGGTSWFQDVVARPDIVLKELAMAFLPDSSLFNSQAKHVRVLGDRKPAMLTAQQCTNDDYSDCKLTSSLICPMVHLDCKGEVRAATAEQRCAPTPEECAAEGADTNAIIVKFTMDGELADKIAANDDEDGMSSKFERKTVAKITEVLLGDRNTDTDGAAHVRMTAASIASARRSLQDSHKTLEVEYLITVNNGRSGQAARDAQRLEVELASSDGSVWGSLKEEFGIQASTATAAAEGSSAAARGHAVGMACLALSALLAILVL